MKTLFSALFGSKPTEAVRRAEPVVNVGLDVGTASTKIVVQDVVDRKAKPIALRLGEAVAGYCPVATPSTVAVADGKLTFGALAERAGPSAVILRSLKVCTACQYNALTCRLVTSVGLLGGPRRHLQHPDALWSGSRDGAGHVDSVRCLGEARGIAPGRRAVPRLQAVAHTVECCSAPRTGGHLRDQGCVQHPTWGGGRAGRPD